MDTRLEEFIEQTQRLTCVASVGACLQRVAAQEGFDNLVYATLRGDRVQALAWAEFPRGYVEAYREGQWDRVDPVLSSARAARLPFAWHQIVEGKSRLRPEQARFLDECRTLGVHSGLTIPLHGPQGRLDLISLSARQPEAPAHDRLPVLYGLALQAWRRTLEVEGETEPHGRPKLTARELECLRWVKDGKTNWEIGTILSVSEKTVEFHVKNIMAKLDASSRVMAVVVAVQQGILQL